MPIPASEENAVCILRKQGTGQLCKDLLSEPPKITTLGTNRSVQWKLNTLYLFAIVMFLLIHKYFVFILSL